LIPDFFCDIFCQNSLTFFLQFFLENLGRIRAVSGAYQSRIRAVSGAKTENVPFFPGVVFFVFPVVLVVVFLHLIFTYVL